MLRPEPWRRTARPPGHTRRANPPAESESLWPLRSPGSARCGRSPAGRRRESLRGRRRWRVSGSSWSRAAGALAH